MPRARVEFVQSQRLAWRKAVLGSARVALDAKVLSRDEQSGATTSLARIPAGWSAEGALNTDEEWLVLAGDLAIGDVTLGSHGYAHLPAGSQNRLASRDGAVALHLVDAAPQSAPAAAFDPARRVLLDALSVPYTGNFHPEFPPGAGRKWLFRDPQGGDETWLLGTLPLRHAERQEVHPVVEEMFLLAGEAHGDHGVMRPGAYFWRPPGIPHGPFGTRTGNLYFFRTVGGPLSTEYIDSEHQFAWDPPYRPVLPPGMQGAYGEADALSDWRKA